LSELDKKKRADQQGCLHGKLSRATRRKQTKGRRGHQRKSKPKKKTVPDHVFTEETYRPKKRTSREG